MSLDADLRTRLSRYLPRDVLDALPDAHALTTAIRQLNSLCQTLSAFVPQPVADDPAVHAELDARQRRGTFLFADVGGFTALAAMLQREAGLVGAELLTQITNAYFAAMLEILAKSNGQLLKFAGDALLAFFPAMPGDADALHAIRAGLRMQRAVRAGFQPVKEPLQAELPGLPVFELTMSIGLSRGNLFEMVVGNAIQRDYVTLGQPPRRAMQAEAAGDRDDVLIDETLLPSACDAFTLEPAADGIWRVRDTLGDRLGDYELVVPGRRRAQPGILIDYETGHLLRELNRQIDALEAVAYFVPPEVVDRLAFRGDHVESENRAAAVVFVYVTGPADLLDAGGDRRLPDVAAMMSRVYDLIQRAVAAHGGSLTRSDPYGRGTKFLITFGAPVAHPDDPQRAVSAALELHRQLDDLSARLGEAIAAAAPERPLLEQRTGIAYGSVFAGEVGWRARREYTVMGDVVNLAARLMARAGPGEILISARVRERVRGAFAAEPLPSFLIPWRSGPVTAFRVVSGTPPEAPASASRAQSVLRPDLNREQAARLACVLLGVADLAPALERWLWSQAGGRQDYVEALIRQLEAANAVEREQDRAALGRAGPPAVPPDDARDLIASQLDQLSPGARDAVRLAAVCGDPFTASILSVVGGVRDPADLSEPLQELITARILEAAAEGSYHFRHGLVHEVAYQSLPRLRRQKLHRLAAGAYLVRARDDATLRRVAGHLSRGGLPLRAIELLTTAADDAEQRGETSHAAALYRIATDLFPHDDSLRAQLARLERSAI